MREWHREDGWGVIDCPDTPGGCFVHFSDLWGDSTPKLEAGEYMTGGYREVFEGETVDFEYRGTSQPGGQDGYSFIATWAWPRSRQAPQRYVHRIADGEQGAYQSVLRIGNGEQPAP